MRRVTIGVLVFACAWLVLAWIAAHALVVSAELPTADAIVILSGASTYKERTQKAAELYREGRAPLVILTNDHTRGGWSSAQQRNPYFVERAQDELTRQGVPAERIKIAPGVASSTHDEALILKEYATVNGLKSVIVVTSAYHSRRALRTLQQAFSSTGTTVGMSPAPTGLQTPSPAFWWVHIEGWRSVGAEYVKLIYYWIRYH
jgi:uncharacterized SAM-binding protein YcdF (DUF218 family)